MGQNDFESELLSLYEGVKGEIADRIDGFRDIWGSRDEERILSELEFCLLTPQSKALSCWAAVERMRSEGICGRTPNGKVEECLKGVRFHHNKAKYLLEAMDRFEGVDENIVEVLERFSSAKEARDWFVKSIKGLGLKEASHFLRNIGYSEELAILDRHILRNLVRAGVLPEVPRALTRERYLSIEARMEDYSRKVGIPMSHLDLLLWFRQTGCVFK